PHHLAAIIICGLAQRRRRNVETNVLNCGLIMFLPAAGCVEVVFWAGPDSLLIKAVGNGLMNHASFRLRNRVWGFFEFFGKVTDVIVLDFEIWLRVLGWTDGVQLATGLMFFVSDLSRGR